MNFKIKPALAPNVPQEGSPPMTTTAHRNKECNETVFDAEGATASKEQQIASPSQFTAIYAAARTTSSFLKAAISDPMPPSAVPTQAFHKTKVEDESH
jgi:hypothetical protein